MPTVYNQPLACRFGVELADLFGEDTWKHFDAAVAWVRRSGMRHLLPALTTFLQRGGETRLIVGIDIENTSQEGLEDLLSLSQLGKAKTFVHHNEYPSVTFHPKVYLFSNDDSARLIIGSNNLTEAGLFTNTEAGLQVDAAVTDPVIVQIRAALDLWCDTADALAHPLDAAFLAELVSEGYVVSEETIRRRRVSQGRTSGGRSRTRRRLFGSKMALAPPPPTSTTVGSRPRPQQRAQSTAPSGGVGAVLLVRPRLSRGGSQMQIPKALRQGPFLANVRELVSDHDNVARPISPTRPRRAGGAVNTYKMELPEGAGINNPIMRVWWTPEGLVRYRVYAPNSAAGSFILQQLEQGRHTDPRLTIVTKPNDPDHATWYRFI